MRSASLAKLLALVGLIFLSFPHQVLAAGEAFPVTRIDVRTKYPSPPPETYRPLIPLEKGKETTAKKIEAVENLLKNSGLFRSVSVTTEEAPEGISVVFDLGQMERVNRIRIKRNWLVLSSSIYRILAMQQGDPFEEATLPAEAERIKALYEKKGWYETVVTYSYDRDPEDGSVRVSYRIRRGHHIRFSPIELEGVQAGDPEQIRKILRIWPWVTAKRLDKRLDKVRAYYGRLGFPAARIRVKALEIGKGEKNRGALHIGIDEGKKLVVNVKGNDALPAREILEATTFSRNQGYGLFDTEDSVETIRKLYEKKGFPDARVTFKRTETDTEVRVSFSVEEGKRAFIGKIAFQGNEAFSDKLLSEQILTRSRDLILLRRGRFLTDKWDKDLGAIVNFYLAEGFQDVNVENSLEPIPGKKDRVLLQVRIHEGPRYTIASSTMRGVRTDWETALREETFLKPGEPFHEGKIVAEARRIGGFYAKRGYLLARVDNDFRVLEDHTVEVTFNVREGPCFRLSGLIITGNRKTRPKTIQKTFRIMGGDPIDNEKLSKTRQRLFRLGIFEGLSLRVPGLDLAAQALRDDGEEEAERPVLIEVREKKSLGVEVGIRYDSDWGLEGLFSLREENLLGRAKKVNVDVLGGQERTEVRLAYADPTLMAQRATLTAQAKYERAVREAYTERRISFESGLFRKLRNEYTPGLFLILDDAVTYDVKSNAPDAPEPSSTTNLFVRPQIVRDTRQDKLYPRDGSYSQARVAVSNQAWGSDDELVIYQLQLQDYFELKPDWILAGRLSLDDVAPYGSTDAVPSTYLLFAGGNNSVRGFPRDGLGPKDLSGTPKGGTTRIIGNMEIRFPIYRLIHGVGFVDVGSLTDGFEEIGFDTFRWSTGAGLRLHTPVGPIRLEYGYQLQENPPLGRGEFHFALGFPF
ncbi:MAG: outer membrane protein assembly factor BamA [Thermodesulfobacteriota bacterium]